MFGGPRGTRRAEGVAPFTRNAARGIDQQLAECCPVAVAVPRGADELKDLAAVRLPEGARVQVENSACGALGKRHYDSTRLARAVARRFAIRAPSAASTRAPSRVMR